MVVIIFLNYILKGLFNETIDFVTASNYSITPKLNCYDNKIRVEFSGSYLKEDKATYAHRKIVNIYTHYEITIITTFKSAVIQHWEKFLFGAVNLTENVDIDKYKCCGEGFKFDRKGEFSFRNGFARNVIIFGVDKS